MPTTGVDVRLVSAFNPIKTEKKKKEKNSDVTKTIMSVET